MIYKLFSSTSEFLLSQPETGMGYQVILGIKQGNYLTAKFVVYNSELILDYDASFMELRAQILSEGYRTVYNKANYLNIEIKRTLSINEIKEVRMISESKKSNFLRHSGGNGAKDNPPKSANGEDYFVRLSAYEDDKRIDLSKKCLRADSYTTTLLDYLTCVKMNDDPVDRYALPNDEKVNWAFYIKPQKGESYQEGIVQPAFGHEGGGIEDYFKNGTLPDTYIGKLQYGKFENK